jgi:hypothetical protein
MSRLLMFIGSIALVAVFVSWQKPEPAAPPRAEIAAASGALSLGNSLDGSAILTVGSLAPGDTAAGQVVLSNTGTLSGDLELTQAELDDSPGPAGGALSQALQLTIREAAGGQTVYSGPLAAFDSRALGGMAPGVTRAYDFTVQLPDGGIPPSPTGGDNAFVGSSVNVRYVWDLDGDDPGGGGDGGGGGGNGGGNGGGGGGGGGSGGGSRGSGGGAGGQPGLPAGKMRVALKVSAKKALKGRIDVAVRCSEPCRLRAYAALRKRGRLKTRRKSARAAVANRKVKIKLKLPKKVKANLSRRLAAKGKDYIVVYVRATDPRGGVVNLKKQVRVKRKRR